MKHAVRVIAHWTLLAHIYISMAGFTLALLFGITGFTLNHEDFGLSTPKITRSQIILDKSLLDPPDQSTIEACVKQKLGLRWRSTDFHSDSDQIQITFAAPGVRTTVTINPATGAAEVEKENRGFLARIGDLHKGLDSGKVWYWVIDASALLLVISSLTGMITLMALRARRQTGYTLGALGVLTVVLIYLLYVPK